MLELVMSVKIHLLSCDTAHLMRFPKFSVTINLRRLMEEYDPWRELVLGNHIHSVAGRLPREKWTPDMFPKTR